MKKNNVFCSNKSKTMIAVLMVVAAVIIAYIAIVYGILRKQLEGFLAQNMEYGLGYYYDIQNFREAEKCFKKALFVEKYEKSADLYEQALLAYEKYLPDDHENIARIHTKVSVIYSILGNNRMILEHAGIANDYYQSQKPWIGALMIMWGPKCLRLHTK